MTDPKSNTDPILEEETSAHMRWWVSASPARDTYDLFIVRYSMRNDDVIDQHYYLPMRPSVMGEFTGGWIQYQPPEVIEPAYRFPGEVLHLFSGTPWIDRGRLEESIQHMATNILMAVGEALQSDDEPTN